MAVSVMTDDNAFLHEALCFTSVLPRIYSSSEVGGSQSLGRALSPLAYSPLLRPFRPRQREQTCRLLAERHRTRDLTATSSINTWDADMKQKLEQFQAAFGGVVDHALDAADVLSDILHYLLVPNFRPYNLTPSSGNSGERSELRQQSFAAVIPGDTLAEAVVTTSISNFLQIYNVVIIFRLVATWFPQAPQAIVGPLSTLCDPYLNLFRGIIPALGGLDFSPILAFLVLNAFTNAAAALPAELPPSLGADGKARGLTRPAAFGRRRRAMRKAAEAKKNGSGASSAGL
eukprot:TRINITY_DN23851_c0_g1_i1.p1 TRINITY_DN23851_c0_g1~~TRINITY_DN23851_c0_g1_i1.p1  ORF type:complete len:288 (+),score=29.67 TRINITY_DN23851_c0_g1_i1:82-945(+)